MHHTLIILLVLSASPLPASAWAGDMRQQPPTFAAAQSRPDLACANGDVATRLDVCSQIIARKGASNWDLFGAHYARGRARLETGDPRGAVDDFSAAMRYDPPPGSASTHLLRGRAHAMLGNLDQAVADFAHALRLKPDFAEAFAERALLRERLGQRGAAIADLKRAVALDPTLQSAREVLRRLGDAD